VRDPRPASMKTKKEASSIIVLSAHRNSVDDDPDVD